MVFLDALHGWQVCAACWSSHWEASPLAALGVGPVNHTITDTRKFAQCLANNNLIDAHTRTLYPNKDIYPFLGLFSQ